MAAMLNPADRNRLRVVLVRTRNPLNIGAVARAMTNFGFGTLRLVQPWAPSFREAQSAVGANELLRSAEVFETVAEAIADCALVVGTSAVRDRTVHQGVTALPQAAIRIRDIVGTQNAALMFGSEKTGLSSEDLSYCNLLMHIETTTQQVSMNLSHAVAVILYEIGRSSVTTGDGSPEGAIASAANLERITETLLGTLKESGYVKGDSAATTEQKVRRLILRMQMREEDAELWLGMLRKILGKLRRS